jgi:hypothetical protein
MIYELSTVIANIYIYIYWATKSVTSLTISNNNLITTCVQFVVKFCYKVLYDYG